MPRPNRRMNIMPIWQDITTMSNRATVVMVRKVKSFTIVTTVNIQMSHYYCVTHRPITTWDMMRYGTITRTVHHRHHHHRMPAPTRLSFILVNTTEDWPGHGNWTNIYYGIFNVCNDILACCTDPWTPPRWPSGSIVPRKWTHQRHHRLYYCPVPIVVIRKVHDDVNTYDPWCFVPIPAGSNISRRSHQPVPRNLGIRNNKKDYCGRSSKSINWTLRIMNISSHCIVSKKREIWCTDECLV